ncbi:hypothetical protein F5146DRAFT_1051600 [Armillaria mellea]|nr:hypothetical protein F5146DRAFT_1051600 [Armillaria mellea]
MKLALKVQRKISQDQTLPGLCGLSTASALTFSVLSLSCRILTVSAAHSVWRRNKIRSDITPSYIGHNALYGIDVPPLTKALHENPSKKISEKDPFPGSSNLDSQHARTYEIRQLIIRSDIPSPSETQLANRRNHIAIVEAEFRILQSYTGANCLIKSNPSRSIMPPTSSHHTRNLLEHNQLLLRFEFYFLKTAFMPPSLTFQSVVFCVLLRYKDCQWRRLMYRWRYQVQLRSLGPTSLFLDGPMRRLYDSVSMSVGYHHTSERPLVFDPSNDARTL